jgi:hypothetical protein
MGLEKHFQTMTSNAGTWKKKNLKRQKYSLEYIYAPESALLLLPIVKIAGIKLCRGNPTFALNTL